MRKRATAAIVLAAIAALAFWWLSRPEPLLLPPSAIPAGYTADAGRGEVLYHAGSCFACHRAAEGQADAALPSGGAPLKTPVGVFFPQNITPDDETGIGRWSALEFVNAMTRGVAPDGRHYFPAFPYAAYRAMTLPDLLDLRAYLMSLPKVKAESREQDVPLVGLARRAVGVWKRVALARPPYSATVEGSDVLKRGSYLVNGPGHCGECHTPKSWLMVEDLERHMAGGPHPAGEGKVPSLRGLLAREKYEDAKHLVLALQNGEELGYENLSSGGMGLIQANLAKLPEEDLRAIAVYLLSLE
jgi:mono/diheme cytochrome c family protein